MSKNQPSARYIIHLIKQHLSRRIWMLVYLFFFGLSTAGFGDMMQARRFEEIDTGINMWDLIFSTLNNPYLYVYAILFLYIYLVSQVAQNQRFHHHILLRLTTRQQYWQQVNILVAAYTVTVTGILLFVVGVFSASLLPLAWSWSVSAQNSPEVIWINHSIIQQLPLVSLVLHACLLLMGFFSIGLLTNLSILIAGHYAIGLSIPIIITTLSIISLQVNFAEPISFFLIHENLILGLQGTMSDSTHSPLWFSFLYWGVISITLYFIGKSWNQRHDFFIHAQH